MNYQQWILEHEIYLKTDKWKLIRDKVLARDHETCQKCKKNGWIVHHLTYARWKNERLEDLVTVCDECHDLIHLAKKTQRSKKNEKKSNPPRKSKVNHKSNNAVQIFIDKILKSKEFVRFDNASRKLLYPHPMEILNHFGFRGETYQEKFDDITQKWFRKEDLAQKLRTMGLVFEKYRKRKN